MSSNQRVIKYVATAFAILLAVGIISAIAGIAINVLSALTGFSLANEDRMDVTENFTDVRSLNIKNITGDLYIKTGDTFRVEGDNVLESFISEVSDDGTLTIKEMNKHSGFLKFDFNWFKSHKSTITVYLPEDFLAESARIDSGAGDVIIDALDAESLIINAGVGDIEGNNIYAYEVEIDCGVGDMKLLRARFTDAYINCGIGDMELGGILLGDSTVRGGIGEVDLELIGSEEDYDIDVDSGIGKVRVNGEKVSKDYQNRSAEHSLNVNGGIGDITIDFE